MTHWQRKVAKRPTSSAALIFFSLDQIGLKLQSALFWGFVIYLSISVPEK